MNLSSVSLFHYTKNLEYLLSILLNGFEFRNITESIPCLDESIFEQKGIEYKELEISHKAICFCDIPLSMAKNHINEYGEYSIGLKKEWAIRNGITPIRYVHKKTPDAINNILYVTINKNKHMEMYGDTIIENLLKELILDGSIDKVEYLNTMNSLPLWSQTLIQTFADIYKDFESHIIKQSAFYRVYEGAWKDRKTGQEIKRTFYNEREWRAIKDDKTHLAFSVDDISKIILKDANEIDYLIDKLKEFGKLDTKSERDFFRKIHTHDDLFKDI